MPTHLGEWLPLATEGAIPETYDNVNNNNNNKNAPKKHTVKAKNNNRVSLPKDKRDRKLVGVDGKWYDVTDFISRHPGGPIIETYVGNDATEVFHSMGHLNVLKYRRPVGTYAMPEFHPADTDFRELLEVFREKGYLNTDWNFVYKKIVVCALMLFSVFLCVIASKEVYVHYAGAVSLTLFWQQCGFFMHDFMHTQVFRDAKKDRICGTIFGTFFFGISAHWWRDEHFVHHALTCVVDVGRQFVDPQMWEDVWAQHPRLFPFYKGLLSYVLIKIQHITFIPVTAFCGRLAIMIDSFRHERRWYEWLACTGHWIWMIFLLSWLPTWREIFTFYFIAAALEGVLHFQLVFSHYCKPFHDMDEFLHGSWYVQQVQTNMNISNPPYLDWFHGGLNFHIEHHLYPLLSRKHLREASVCVRAICEKQKIVYDSAGFFNALGRTLSSLKNTSRHYSFDPR